jgi:basic amino acid/polyamine antiporter, APA family
MSETRELKRSLGLIDATSLVAGSMIGSGIFLVSADMSRDLGSSGWLLVAWILTGIITLMAALSYGELAGMMPDAGGQYVYIRRAWGRLPAFLYGWTVFAVIQTGVIAAVATAFANYSSVLIPALEVKTPLLNLFGLKITRIQLFGVASIFFLTWINTRGVNTGATVQKIFTSAKLVALFGLIAAGLIIGLQTNTFSNNFADAWTPSHTFQSVKDGPWITEMLTTIGFLAILGKTMINSLFSADAWNNVTFIAGEIREPQKNIPRSLVLGTAIVTGLYLLANIAYLALLPLKGDPNASETAKLGIQFAVDGRVGAAAAKMIFGNAALILMAVLIMISTFGCNNGIVMAGGRLYYAMAKDGLFFKKAGELNRFNVPAFAMWMQAIWASGLCFSGSYGDLLAYCTFASLIFYIVTIAGIFVLRKREPDAPRPYKALGYPYIPALYIFFAAIICIDLLIMDPRNSLSGLVIIAIGLIIWFVQKGMKKEV